MIRLLFPILLFTGCFGASCSRDIAAPDQQSISSDSDGVRLTLEITDVPDYYTPLLDSIFVYGSFNNYSIGDRNYALTKTGLEEHEISFYGKQGDTLRYKFTRGSSNINEATAAGGWQELRTHVFKESDETETLTIANWADMLVNHTAVGNTRILDIYFFIPQLNRMRRVWVYLPPDYYSTSNHYQVMYMQDGQNLFDAPYSFVGEWKVDEELEELFGTSQTTGCIIVGIDNGGANRINEYSPWVNTQYGGGQGDEYETFLINTLKPFIDSYFRTLSGRENTGIMGSSLGGLISWYIALHHQEIFSQVGVFSPSFWFVPEIMTFAQSTPKQYDMQFYFLAGTGEGVSVDQDIQSVMNYMTANGFTSSEMTYKLTAGQHNETFWSQEFSEAFLWLY